MAALIQVLARTVFYFAVLTPFLRRGRKVAAICIVVLILFFLPGILRRIGSQPPKDEKPAQSDTNAWHWTWEEIWLSFKEAACALPYSQCEWRPYHRQCLSFFICNALVCLFSTAMFYPGYTAGVILPLPSLTIHTRIRIGRFDISR